MPDQAPSFNLAALESAVASTPFAGHLHHIASTPSTNDLAHAAAQGTRDRPGARHGVWIADEQTAGRGRSAHAWHSPAGDGLYMTALISPPIPMQSALGLSLRVAIAVQAAIAQTYGFAVPTEIDIRWPNDLMLHGRKVGGILIDTTSIPATPTQPSMLRYAVLGIGINLNQTTFPPDLQPFATSILRESLTRQERYEVQPLATAILLAIDTEIRALLTPNLGPRILNLSAYSTWITGKRVRVEPRKVGPGELSASYTGTTAGLNPGGFLLVNGDDGQLHTVLSGGLREP